MEGINYNWTFLESINNIVKLREEYESGLKKIPPDDLKGRTQYIKNIRDEIYKIDLKLGQIELLWSYMNGDIEFEILISQVRK